jgi:hypothetical protein
MSKILKFQQSLKNTYSKQKHHVQNKTDHVPRITSICDTTDTEVIEKSIRNKYKTNFIIYNQTQENTTTYVIP